MKANIHPKWYPEARVVCACGHTFTVGSTKPEIHVEICAKCHPFFTGEEKFVDVASRIEKFQAKRAAAKPPKKKKERIEETERPQTLKEMLTGKE